MPVGGQQVAQLPRVRELQVDRLVLADLRFQISSRVSSPGSSHQRLVDTSPRRIKILVFTPYDGGVICDRPVITQRVNVTHGEQEESAEWEESLPILHQRRLPATCVC